MVLLSIGSSYLRLVYLCEVAVTQQIECSEFAVIMKVCYSIIILSLTRVGLLIYSLPSITHPGRGYPWFYGPITPVSNYMVLAVT